MEAKSTGLAVCLCGLAAIAGCMLPPTASKTTPERNAPTAPPSKSEQAAEPTTPDDVKPAADVATDLADVERWIEQIRRRDDLHSRVSPTAAARPLSAESETTYGEIRPPHTNQRSKPQPQKQPDAGEPPEQQPPSESETPETVSAAPAPILRGVSVRPASPAASPRSPTNPPSLTVNAPASAASHLPSLEQLADHWLESLSDTSFRDQLDQRLLLVLAGKYERAQQPLEMVSSEQQQLAADFLDTLITLRESHGGEPETEAARMLKQAKRLERALARLSDPAISRLVLARSVRAFGQYEEFDPPHFPAGRENEFVVYCEVENFQSRLCDDGTYEALFAEHITLLTPTGEIILELKNDHILDKCQTRRTDCFIARLVRLPTTLPPGQYVAQVKIVDKIKQKVAAAKTTFRIVARS